jgi:hypothetical protein
MNFETINSPADLVKANAANPVAQFVDQLDELGPVETLAVAQMLTEKLHTFHCNIAARGDIGNPQVWAHDAGMLEVAVNILNNIAL